MVRYCGGTVTKWRRSPEVTGGLGGGADDTMNLGGIKVSSAEIEHVLQKVPGVFETAAIAVSPDGGPSQLVIYAVCKDAPQKEAMIPAMRARSSAT